MKDLFQHHRRLCELADQICEGTLTQQAADELQRLVAGDPEAPQVLVLYLELHTQLFWDNGHVASPEVRSLLAGESPAISSRDSDPLQVLFHERETIGTGTSPRQRSANPRRSGLLKGVSLVATLMLLITGGIVSLQNRQTENPENTESIVETNDNPLNDSTTESDHPNSGMARSDPKGDDRDLPPELPRIDWQNHPDVKDPKFAENQVEGSPTRSSEKQLGVAYEHDNEVIAAINRRISSSWRDYGVEPSDRADDYEWVRRVYLDLVGRIPTPEELSRFLEDDPDHRDRKLVDRLLESQEFALQWSTNWSMLLVGRAPGPQVDRLGLQKYLHEVAAKNRPWSQAVGEMVAARGNSRDNGATNFLLAHLNNEAVPATAFVARSLLGYQIQCAQCHHHPFYSMSQKEFWELNSFFKQASVARVQTDGQSPVYELRDEEQSEEQPTYYEDRQGVLHAAFPKYNEQKVSPEKDVSRREQLAELLVVGEDPLVSQAFVNRTWSFLFGYGFTRPVDDLGPHNPPTHPELFATLSRSFVKSNYDIKRLYRWICLSEPYRLSSRMTDENESDDPRSGALPAFSRMYFKPLTPEQLYDSLQAISGDLHQRTRAWPRHVQRRDEWVSQFVSSFENDENDEASHFDGTISQALVMMNGDLVLETIAADRNEMLAQLVNASMSDQKKFEQLCLTALSRKPRPQEMALFRQTLSSLRNARSASEKKTLLANHFSDFLWAYLNSSEFIMNH